MAEADHWKIGREAEEAIRKYLSNFLAPPHDEWDADVRQVEQSISRADPAKELAQADVFELMRESLPWLGAPLPIGNADAKKEWLDRHVADIVAKLKTYPRKHVLRIALAGFQVSSPTALVLASDIRIVVEPSGPPTQAPDAWEGAPYTINHGSSEYSTETFLEVTGSGYLASQDSAMLVRMLGRVKQCLFLLSHLKFIGPTPLGVPGRRPTIVDTVSSHSTTVHSAISLSGRFNQIGLTPVNPPEPNTRGPFFLARRVPYSQSEVEKMLRPIEHFFSISGADERNISAAMEWWADSTLGSDQTLNYVAACIGLEALLGQGIEFRGDGTGRLVDRYAYMMGKNPTHRLQLAQQLKDALATRGEVVHGRNARLVGEQLKKLDQIRLMLRRAIVHELIPYGYPPVNVW